ncbi:MAG: hypothetical protein WAM24_05185, partial [Ignavibacteriaceae bacterium]
MLKYYNIYSLVLIILNTSYLFSQSNINPDISLIGMFNTHTNFSDGAHDKGKIIFDYPSLELYVDGYLNPYARAAADISYEGEEFGVEELYANIVRGLPLDIQIKAGKYLLGFGKINTVHGHAWPFLKRPLYQQIYFGEEGFNDIGINLSFLIPTSDFYTNLDLGIFKGDAIANAEVPGISLSDINSLRGSSPIFTGRLCSFFTLSDFSNLETGISASFGVHANSSYYYHINNIEPVINGSLRYFYSGFDFKYKHRPDSYTALTVQGEAILNNRDVLRTSGQENIRSFYKEKINTFGAFIFIDYLFNKQYSIGVKYDFTYGIAGDEPAYNTLSNDDKNKTNGISGWIG